LTIRLEKSEALAITLGISGSVKRKRTVEKEHKDDASGQESSSDDGEGEDSSEEEDDAEKEQSSSSSDDEQGGSGAQSNADQKMETSTDSSAPIDGPGDTSKGTSAAPANRLSFKEALENADKRLPQDAAIFGTSSGTDSVPAHRKLISLSSLGAKKDD
jgi:hypothetical protein